ncbi:MAG: type II secretion system F family protein [Alphaproteobacteria bacterium]
MKIALIILGLLLIAGLGYGLWFLLTIKRRQNLKRIERIRMRKVAAVKSGQDMSLRRKTDETKGLVYWLMKPLPDFKRLGETLERAGKNISPKKYIFHRLIWFVGIAVILSMKLNPALAVAIALITGIWIPIKFLKRKINKRNKAFLRLFPDAIDLIVRGLRSGLPVSESLTIVSTEIPDPVGSVFANVSNTMKLGVPMEKALHETAKKLDLTEFNFFTTSIVLQRETGGNLSEILNNLSEVLRGRFIMQMKIKAMSSEAKASAIIVGALPFFVVGAVSIMSPHYMAPLINDYRGNIAAFIAAGMMISGGLVMNRMTKFEI